jgi:S-(hydroxymethyl)glutathione dehydrogenase / alcohol dehydrogenase
MKTNAAILWEQGQPLSVEAADLEAPRTGEVLVEVKAAGVCHSDLHAVRGDWRQRTPLALGHEGAGIVRALGENVARVKVGDRVVFCWAPPCGVCRACLERRPVLCERLDRTTYRNQLPGGGTRLRAQNKDIAHFNGTACFADYAVVAEEGVIPVPTHVSFTALATLGCAVITGMGAALNAAQLTGGEEVVVIGVGGVGLNVVQGARIAGSQKIIAVDTRPKPLELARNFGATECINAAEQDLKKVVPTVTNGRGADYVFDTVGAPETIQQSLAITRKGGTVILTGLSRTDALASVPVFPFVLHEKRLIGSLYGSGQPLNDISRLIDLYEVGQLKLDELASRTYKSDQVNDALEALASGEGARGVILW